MKRPSIPIYSIDKFQRQESPYSHFQVEVFDADRHFEVEYPHRHDFFEVLFLTKGKGTHIIDDRSYEITPYSVFFLSPGQIHSIDYSEDVEGYIYLFTQDFFLIDKSDSNQLIELPFFFTLDGNNPPILLENLDDRKLFEQLFQRGCKEIRKKDQHAQNVSRAILETILALSARLYDMTSDSSHIPGSTRLIVKQFRQILEDKYQENLSVHQYAEMLGITSGHLTECIKNVTGRTTSDLIDEKIILECKRLLLHTSLSATEIAHLLGFKDQSYFTRYFKRLTGKTPKLFRDTSS